MVQSAGGESSKGQRRGPGRIDRVTNHVDSQPGETQAEQAQADEDGLLDEHLQASGPELPGEC